MWPFSRPWRSACRTCGREEAEPVSPKEVIALPPISPASESIRHPSSPLRTPLPVPARSPPGIPSRRPALAHLPASMTSLAMSIFCFWIKLRTRDSTCVKETCGEQCQDPAWMAPALLVALPSRAWKALHLHLASCDRPLPHPPTPSHTPTYRVLPRPPPCSRQLCHLGCVRISALRQAESETCGASRSPSTDNDTVFHTCVHTLTWVSSTGSDRDSRWSTRT